MSSRPLRTAGLVALFLALAALGFALTRYFGPPVSADLQTPPPIDVNAIQIEMPDLNGELMRLANWRDGPLLINFWATWCPPCRDEIPLLKSLQDEYASDGLTVIGVALDELDAVGPYAESMGINYPVLIGDENGVTLAGALGVNVIGLPISVFVDRSGHITRVHTGEIHRDDADMALRELLPLD